MTDGTSPTLILGTEEETRAAYRSLISHTRFDSEGNRLPTAAEEEATAAEERERKERESYVEKVLKPVGGAFGQWMEANRQSILEEMASQTGFCLPDGSLTPAGAANFGYRAGRGWAELNDKEKARWEERYNAALEKYNNWRHSKYYSPPGLPSRVRSWERKPRDPKAPKRPRNGVLGAYVDEHRPKLMEKLRREGNKSDCLVRATQQLMREFPTLSQEEVRIYAKKAEERMKDYNRLLAVYKEELKTYNDPSFDPHREWRERSPRKAYAPRKREPQAFTRDQWRYQRRLLREAKGIGKIRDGSSVGKAALVQARKTGAGSKGKGQGRGSAEAAAEALPKCSGLVRGRGKGYFKKGQQQSKQQSVAANRKKEQREERRDWAEGQIGGVYVPHQAPTGRACAFSFRKGKGRGVGNFSAPRTGPVSTWEQDRTKAASGKGKGKGQGIGVDQAWARRLLGDLETSRNSPSAMQSGPLSAEPSPSGEAISQFKATTSTALHIEDDSGRAHSHQTAQSIENSTPSKALTRVPARPSPRRPLPSSSSTSSSGRGNSSSTSANVGPQGQESYASWLFSHLNLPGTSRDLPRTSRDQPMGEGMGEAAFEGQRDQEEDEEGLGDGHRGQTEGANEEGKEEEGAWCDAGEAATPAKSSSRAQPSFHKKEIDSKLQQKRSLKCVAARPALASKVQVQLQEQDQEFPATKRRRQGSGELGEPDEEDGGHGDCLDCQGGGSSSSTSRPYKQPQRPRPSRNNNSSNNKSSSNSNNNSSSNNKTSSSNPSTYKSTWLQTQRWCWAS